MRAFKLLIFLSIFVSFLEACNITPTNLTPASTNQLPFTTANIQVVEKKVKAYLYDILQKRDVEQLLYLLSSNQLTDFIVKLRDEEGKTLLHHVAEWGTPNLIHSLLELKIDLNVADYYAMTPLDYAAKSGNEETLISLLAFLKQGKKTGGHLHSLINQIDYAIDFAIHNEKMETFRILLNHYPITEKHLLLPRAISRSEIKTCEQLIAELGLDKKMGSYKYRDSAGKTLLHLAVDTGNPAIVRWVIKKIGIDVNKRDNAGRTPLIDALEKGETQIASLLIDHGSYINLRCHANRLPLHYAASYEETGKEIIREIIPPSLLRNKVNLEIATIIGDTPLHIAVKKENRSIVRQLLKNRAYVNSKDQYGRTPFQILQHLERPPSKNLKKIGYNLLKHKASIEINSWFDTFSGSLSRKRKFLRDRTGAIRLRNPLVVMDVDFIIKPRWHTPDIIIKKGEDQQQIAAASHKIRFQPFLNAGDKLGCYIDDSQVPPAITNALANHTFIFNYKPYEDIMLVFAIPN